MEKRVFGKTGFEVTPIWLGTSALGSFPQQYGYEVNPSTAVYYV
jgi:D-threo-aldose 1-dehydrogenase